MQVIDIIAQLPMHPTRKYRRRGLKEIKRIVLHHSATDTGTPEAFARYHVEKLGWPGIAYTYVVGRDGTVYRCQEDSTISYHAAGANKDSLGVCMVGNFDNYEPSMQQLRAAMDLLQWLCGKYGLGIKAVIGHREVPGTKKSCPGKRINMDKLRALLQDMMDSEG